MQNTQYSFSDLVRDLGQYIRPYRTRFWFGVFFRFTSDLSQLYPVWALSQIVAIFSKPLQPSVIHTLVILLVGWFLAAGYRGFAHNFSKYLGYYVSEQASLDLFKDCLAHILRLDFEWQEKENSGNKLKRIDKGHDGVNDIIRRIFDVFIEVFVNTVGISFIFFTLDWKLSLALVFFIVSYYFIGTVLLKKAAKQEHKVNKLFENLGGLAFESLNNIQTIKALAIDKGIMKMVVVQIRTLVAEIRNRIILYRIQSTALVNYESFFGLLMVAVICYGILHGYYTVSILILFIGFFQKVNESTRELTDVTQDIIVAKIWVARAMHILRTEPEIENVSKVKTQFEYPNSWKTLQVDHLSFQYHSTHVLKDISFQIQRGQKVGIVGLSGAGKSTLFKLLLDLYESYDGEILLGDTPLRHIRRQEYIDHVSVVLQDTELFDMSLKDNIAIAGVRDRAVDEGKLKEVLHTAHLEDVIANLPNGVDTIVGEKGFKLSGGQRQRVGIARALYRQPDILLFDEATSHLDVHSEKEIQKVLQESLIHFTTIVIAHRLSTIKEMDKIIVLQNGKVIEEGSFEKLLALNGTFSKMWQEQKL